jgi:hypothetical protein
MSAKVKEQGKLSARDVNSQEWLMLARALPGHEDQWLVNRLISRLLPFDFVSRFIFDKQGFYETYSTYDTKFRAQVVSKLESTYLTNKPKLRARLYQTE